jgi:CRISPR-associated protein Csb3
MNAPEPGIRINVDPANPGQFFACCGLFELADRRWPGCESRFDKSGLEFSISHSATKDLDAGVLLDRLIHCEMNNTLTDRELHRFEELKEKKKAELDKQEEQERKDFEKQWREAALILGEPFHLRLDWFLDDRAGGSRFKTWAGMQSVIDIARSMKKLLLEGEYGKVLVADWLSHASGQGVSFNLDSNEGAHSSALDVGFVLDPLNLSSRTRPLLELAAFAGLQRFRPRADVRENRQTYSTWTIPLPPVAAMAAVSGQLSTPFSRTFEFPLLYRTKYLKSFLPAKPLRGA